MATVKTVIDSLFYTNPANGDVTEANFTLPFGTCETAAATAAKAVTCANFVALETGASVVVKFTYANTASSATLNVNSTGAKTIKTSDGQALSGSNLSPWKAGDIVNFVYDGTNWRSYAAITRKDLVDAIAQNDALTYKGTIPVSSTVDIFPETFPLAVNRGWTYKVAAAGYLGSVKVEAGDMIIFNTDCDGTNTKANSTTYFDVIQGNMDMKALEDKFSEADHTHSYSHTHKVSHTPAGTNENTSITPKGSVVSTFSGNTDTLTGAVTTKSAGGHTHTFTGTAAEHDHTFAGSAATISVKGTPTGSVSSTSVTPDGNITEVTVDSTHTANYTPKGSITASFSGTEASHNHSFTGTKATLSVDYTPEGNNAEVTLTPDGVNSAVSHSHTLDLSGSFTGIAATITSSEKFVKSGSIGNAGGHTPTGTISSTTNIPSGKTANYTPAGYVPQTSITVGSNDIVSAVTSVTHGAGSHVHNPATLTMSATSKKLSITFSGGSGSHSDPTVSTTTDNVIGTATTFNLPKTNLTGTPAYFTFAGTAVADHTHTFSPSTENVSASYTPTGSVSVSGTASSDSHTHTFTGTTAAHTHAFTGTEATLSTEYTPAGSIGNKAITPAGTVSASFSGTATHLDFVGIAASHDHTFTGSEFTSSGSYTPAGTIAKTSITPAGTLDTQGSHTHDATLAMDGYTPSGTVSSTFTGTAEEHTHTFTGTAATITTTDQSATTTSAANK